MQHLINRIADTVVEVLFHGWNERSTRMDEVSRIQGGRMQRIAGRFKVVRDSFAVTIAGGKRLEFDKIFTLQD